MGLVFGKNARKQIARGDLVASFQYEDGDEAMVLAKRYTTERNRPVVVIKLGDAYRYANEAYLVQAAAEICERLGFGTSWFTTKRIADFISDMLIELVTMKPLPSELEAKRPDMDVTFNDNGIQIVMEEPRLH